MLPETTPFVKDTEGVNVQLSVAVGRLYVNLTPLQLSLIVADVRKFNGLLTISPKAVTRIGCVGQAKTGARVSAHVKTRIVHVLEVHKPVLSQIVKQTESMPVKRALGL